MAVDATGTPSSPDNIPTYNTGGDAPSGKGLNNIVASIQGLFTALRAGTMPGGKIATAGIVPGTNGQILTTVAGASAWAAAPTSTTIRKTTAKAVNTTVAATDLLNGEITIGANTMGATGLVRLTAFGDWKNNSGGAAVVPRFQLLLGGTTIFDTNTPAGTVTSSAVRGSWELVAKILNTATNTQVCSLTLVLAEGGGVATGATGIVFTTGQGTYSIATNAATAFLASGYNTAAKDTTGALALVLNVINGSANAAYETALTGALVEII